MRQSLQNRRFFYKVIRKWVGTVITISRHFENLTVETAVIISNNISLSNYREDISSSNISEFLVIWEIVSSCNCFVSVLKKISPFWLILFYYQVFHEVMKKNFIRPDSVQLIYEINLSISSKYRKILTTHNSIFGHFSRCLDFREKYF